jgi:hypothetical protein
VSILTVRLGARVFQTTTAELQEVDDAETLRRSGRSPFLVRLGFAAWSETPDELLDDRMALDDHEVPFTPKPLTTSEIEALQSTLVVVRRQEVVYLLDGLDTDRHLVGPEDSRGRLWHARTRQSPFLVGLSFAAAVADRDLLSRPTDASCVEL